MMERYEEMNRMREHVMKEVDKDRDSMISYMEFVDSTNQKDFEKDAGWDVSITARFLFSYDTAQGKYLVNTPESLSNSSFKLGACYLFQFFQSMQSGMDLLNK